MNRIHLLPEQVANQIAAGEVVERPASVVKELVENALDAQATRVTVEIQAGGRSLVRVTDDGLGMSRDDALLCLERHATSKIQRAEDLSAIVTMGFRGEALPSIASVSRFTLTTRERDTISPEGTQIVVNGGKIVEVKAAGSAPGTSIEVRQIFFNLPARRKFLRTEETEAAHIQHYLTLAALAFPEVAFTFQKDGRPMWQLPAAKSGPEIPARLAALRERLRALYGDEQKLLAVNFSATLTDDSKPDETESFETAQPAGAGRSTLNPQRSTFQVWGFIGVPGVSRSTREDQHTFVNRRPVENRGLNFALLEGYHTALMKGRYPVCCLFLEIDPAAVDVNIHPSKREVKFHRESEVRKLVAQAVRETLLAFHSTDPKRENLQPPTSDLQRPTPPTPPVIRLPGMEKAPEAIELPNFPPPLPQRPAMFPTKTEQPALKIGFAFSTAASPTPPRRSETEKGRPAERPMANPQSPILQTGAPTPLLSVPLRLVGVIGRLYVVLESDRGLVLLDQHAAHERILFEQMLDRLERNEQAPSQKLLLPETIELSPRDAQFLREQLAALARLGVGLGEFGERTFLLDALPPFVKVSDSRRFVLDLVDELKAVGREVNSARLGEHVVAKTVCRHAVKANDPLAGRELENLVEDLRRCAMPYTCPHGRPTLIEMNYRELEKKFGRTQ
ncbi:MAG: DNA mismatch repair endonuclease MutL [Verrucomicrobia bacterium]|jgi:DNA mismatch repair protein MutL|nr:DNA mismatch repair endonuclease MutL [Verrucomicrobiota bacterium]